MYLIRHNFKSLVIRKRELWDEWFQEGHRVASLDDETTISYMALKACSTLVAKERDIIIVEHKSNLPDKPQVIDYVTTSCIPSFSSQEDDSVQDPLLNVPIHPSRVRAHLTLGAWRLEFLKDYPGVIRTKISYVIQINVKGSGTEYIY